MGLRLKIVGCKKHLDEAWQEEFSDIYFVTLQFPLYEYQIIIKSDFCLAYRGLCLLERQEEGRATIGNPSPYSVHS